MKSELIIDAQPQEVTIALLEDQRLVEFQKEGLNTAYSVGNIYAARVKKIMPGLNACFVEVGHEREAFLHYQDLGVQFLSIEKYIKQVSSDRKKLVPLEKAGRQPDLKKDGTIDSVLELGQEILVQITKEPINTKGPRLSGEISIAGRYLVLIPFTDKVSVSSKIKSSEERARLKQLIQSVKPKNVGVIVRTVAEGKKVAELDNELNWLLDEWNECMRRVQQAPDLPVLAHEETSRTVSVLRDLFNPSYESIYVNDETVFKEVKSYVSLIAPECSKIVKLYKGSVPIFDNYDVTKQIKSGFGRTVSYNKGAYLIIEHTEALTVIDVNSGNRKRDVEGQEGNAFEVNMGAADEIARQLRLRDIGGIIVIDFIDMDKSEHRQKLYEHMNDLLRPDRAKHNVLPLSKFGLMQITRQRVRPAMDVKVEEVCPTCFGKGTIRSSYIFTDTLDSKVHYMAKSLGKKNFTLYCHPYVHAYLNQGFPSQILKWKMKYGFGVKVVPDQSLAFLQYKFKNRKGEEINMEQDIDSKA
ncbi:MAG: Rne/Rng family ribonuclease [Bacteroidales bacterium]|nr:Rne/Rng family ribonuclease [Bacteroidales bacterium]